MRKTSQKGFHKGLYSLANNKLEKNCLEWMILVGHFSKWLYNLTSPYRQKSWSQLHRRILIRLDWNGMFWIKFELFGLDYNWFQFFVDIYSIIDDRNLAQIGWNIEFEISETMWWTSQFASSYFCLWSEKFWFSICS